VIVEDDTDASHQWAVGGSGWGEGGEVRLRTGALACWNEAQCWASAASRPRHPSGCRVRHMPAC
jgi:hypothetical protein